MESIKSKTLNEFKMNILKYKTSIKKSTMKKYFSYLKKLMPLYENLIWNKDYNKLVKMKNKIKNLMKKTNYDDLIRQTAIFYGVQIDKIGIINIAFYPIPYGNNIKAYRIKNLETIGILISKKQNIIWLTSATILHEISHTIYFKSKIVNKNFNFKNKKRKLLVIEGFATAIGAGWGYNRLTSKNSIYKQWYNNKDYDKVAKKIYPKLKIYLDNNRTIDSDLIKYIKKL